MEMDFFPTLELNLIGGWMLILIWLVIQALSLMLVPRDVRRRLFEFDRSSWKKWQRMLFAFGKVIAGGYLVMAALTPIELTSIEFLIGFALFSIGLSGLVIAIYNFKNLPLDRPVTVGLYRFSRHPQLIMLFILGIGLAVALGSWILLLLRVMSFALQHPGVLAEENECIKRFGRSYQEYMEKVPQYLIW